jgi:hypothetical protein
VAIPPLCVDRTRRTEIQNRYVPRDSQRKHRLAEQIAYDVVSGEPAHGSAVLTRHHRQVRVVHPRGGDIACGEHVRHADHTQVVVDRHAAEPVAVHAKTRGQRIGPHARTPHHRRRGQHFAGRQGHPGHVDRGDTDPYPGLHAVGGQRGLDHRPRRRAHVRADVRIAVHQGHFRCAVGEERGQPRRQLACGLNAGEARADHHRGAR